MLLLNERILALLVLVVFIRTFGQELEVRLDELIIEPLVAGKGDVNVLTYELISEQVRVHQHHVGYMQASDDLEGIGGGLVYSLEELLHR